MRLSDLAGPKFQDGPGPVIAGLTADSREVQPGFLFAALSGTNHDGAAFAGQAIERGAAAILSARPIEAPVPVIVGGDPRLCLARMAARFYRSQPETLVAVTGTNGKSSIVWLLRQLWQHCGLNAASLGTLGVTTRNGHMAGGLTTPDPVALHRRIAALANDGVTHLALEASSHGLDQRRLDGLRVGAAAFTNLSHDHLDYHATPEAYLLAKTRLFTELLAKGAPAIINIDSAEGRAVAASAALAGCKLITYGRRDDANFRFAVQDADLTGQTVALHTPQGTHSFRLSLIGDFQAENVVASMALAAAHGADLAELAAAGPLLQGAPGRLQPAGRQGPGAAFIDYAHTPAALEAAIRALKAHAPGRIVTVFGCGGDRDKAKRPVMGRIAAKLSDIAIVTDDNPRTEDAAEVRREIMAAAPGAIEIGDRRAAIFHAVGMLRPGDVALIAGKGHESGQIVGDQVLPFDDLSVTGEAMEALI